MPILKTRILNKHHSYELQLGGSARQTLVVSIVVETDEPTPRRFGPFERTFDRAVAQSEIDRWMDDEKRALEDRI